MESILSFSCSKLHLLWNLDASIFLSSLLSLNFFTGCHRSSHDSWLHWKPGIRGSRFGSQVYRSRACDPESHWRWGLWVVNPGWKRCSHPGVQWPGVQERFNKNTCMNHKMTVVDDKVSPFFNWKRRYFLRKTAAETAWYTCPVGAFKSTNISSLVRRESIELNGIAWISLTSQVKSPCKQRVCFTHRKRVIPL